MVKIEEVLDGADKRQSPAFHNIVVSPRNHARLMKLKKDLKLKSVDAVVNRLLDAAEESDGREV